VLTPQGEGPDAEPVLIAFLNLEKIDLVASITQTCEDMRVKAQRNN